VQTGHGRAQRLAPAASPARQPSADAPSRKCSLAARPRREVRSARLLWDPVCARLVERLALLQQR
jgi:hypothetical protein